MLRWSLCFALLFLLAPAPGRADPPAKDPRTALAKRVTFPGFHEPLFTLRDALKELTDRYGLKIDVDVKQFKAAGFADVLATTPAAEKPLPAQKNVSVGVVLQQVLNRLPRVGTTATYVLRGNGVQVVLVSEEVIRSISQEARASVARGRLARNFTADRALADKPTLDNLARYLKDKHDLQLVVQTGPDAADSKLQLPRFGTVNLETLLKQVAGQTNAKVLLRHDHVLLITPDAGRPPVGM
jgi:hypothetical protein